MYSNQRPVFVIVQGAQESIPPAYVVGEAGTKNRIAVPACQAGNRFLGSLKGLQMRAQYRKYFTRGGHFRIIRLYRTKKKIT
jgi:hypothetical protein